MKRNYYYKKTLEKLRETEYDPETQTKIDQMKKNIDKNIKDFKSKKYSDSFSRNIGSNPELKKGQERLHKISDEMAKDKQREKMIKNIQLGVYLATPIVVVASALGLTYWQSYKRLKKSCKKKFPNDPKGYRFCMKGGNKKLKVAKSQGKLKRKARGK